MSMTFIIRKRDSNTSGEDAEDVPSKERPSTAGASFIKSLCELLEARLGSLEYIFDSFQKGGCETWTVREGEEGAREIRDKDVDEIEGEGYVEKGREEERPPPLCHGLMLALRYCIQEVHTTGLLNPSMKYHKNHNHPHANAMTDSSATFSLPSPSSLVSSLWCPLVKRILTLSLNALRIAMLVVAEAPYDNQFAPAPTVAMIDKNAVAVKGPVNSTTVMSASYMNTNGSRGATSGDGEVDNESTMQRAVVAAWLLVKEASAMLSLLVEISPPSSRSNPVSFTITSDKAVPLTSAGSSLAPNSSELLSVGDISSVGAKILDALGRLKHMGAIAETHAALQAVSATLFK
jgi:hypothetical protein